MVLLFLLNGCFFDPDGYQKKINNYFFLYSENGDAYNICLGSIEYGQYRLSDNYICTIKKIGWDKSFLIVETGNHKYFIQELSNLRGKNLEVFRKYLHGPLPIDQYQHIRDSLHVAKNLGFTLTF